MPHVLVVEDSPDQARLIAGLLESAGHSTEISGNGREALEAIGRKLPDLVVTDLVMPELNGLELVEAVTRERPSLPIVLMTAYGSGEIAMQALEKGASSYVPKRLLNEELVSTAESILELARARKDRERLFHSLVASESQFRLDNDVSLIPPLVTYIEETIAACRDGVNETELMQLGLALREALLNAIHHGNLGVGSKLRETSNEDYLRAVDERLGDPRYRDRKVHLSVSVTPELLTLVVRDEGEGFDLDRVPDPTDPEGLLRSSGRGLYLIGTFMDEVTHNERGNQITMTKSLAPKDEPGEPTDDGEKRVV